MADAAPFLLEVDALRKYFPIRRGFFSKTLGLVKAVDGGELRHPPREDPRPGG